MVAKQRRTMIVTAVIALAVVGGAAVAVPPLLSAAVTGPDAGSTAPPTPVISATAVPEPPPRTPLEGELTLEQEMAISEREEPRATALNEILQGYPDDYAYGYITDAGFGVGFKFDAPAEALGVLDAVGDPYELHENVGFTEAEILPQVSEVSDLVHAAVPQVGSFSVSANPYTVTVEVELFTGAGDTDAAKAPEGAELEALLTDLRAVLYPGFDVEIMSQPGEIVAG
jgi:hypothetical protein